MQFEKKSNLEKLKSQSLFLKVATVGAWTICAPSVYSTGAVCRETPSRIFV